MARKKNKVFTPQEKSTLQHYIGNLGYWQIWKKWKDHKNFKTNPKKRGNKFYLANMLV